MFQFPTAKKIKNKALKIAFSAHTKRKLLINLSSQETLHYNFM